MKKYTIGTQFISALVNDNTPDLSHDEREKLFDFLHDSPRREYYNHSDSVSFGKCAITGLAGDVSEVEFDEYKVVDRETEIYTTGAFCKPYRLPNGLIIWGVERFEGGTEYVDGRRIDNRVREFAKDFSDFDELDLGEEVFL